MERITAIVKKEFIHLSRDPRMILILLFIPIFQTIIFGLVVNTDIRNVEITVYDMERSDKSRSLIREITSTGYFSITSHTLNLSDIDRNILTEKSKAGIIIGEDLTNIQILIDGTDSQTASLIIRYLSAILERFIKKEAFSQNRNVSEIEIKTRNLYNPNLNSRLFFVPGVVALIITVIITLLSSMAIVREKEAGTIDQIMVTPIKRYEFILGKLIPFAIIGYIDVALATIAARLVFDIPFLGSVPLLFAGTTLYLTAMLGIGLIISTVSSTQQEAMMTTFFFIFPSLLLSGFIFPIFNMPYLIRLTTYLNPLTYFMIITRTIFLKGSGLKILYPQFSALFVLALTIMTVAIKRFRKHL